MPKWYQWLFFALSLVVSCILEDFRYFKNPTFVAVYYGTMIGIMIALSILQYICDKKGKKGEKVFTRIRNIVILLLAIFLGYLIITG